ncbi:MAG: phospholipase D-like domain-containing protein [Spirosomaceae bacterium]|nr:phospholipase D-like domain-containing protein [Spirosomataceae bacterium]
MPSKFFTNEPERNLFDKFKGIIAAMGSNLHAFHAVVGYFRSSGYFALQPYLKDIPSVKILVGINVDKLFADAQRKGLLFFGDEKKTKEAFMEWFVQDMKEAKYSKEVEEGVLQFIEDLVSGKIKVRASSHQTIHAKFYLLLPQNHTEHSDGWVIMGSSNLTNAGMGVTQSPNYELNIALKDYDDVQFTKEEFEKLWKKSIPILPADIQSFKQKTHLGQNFSPYELYIKFLIEYFGKANIDYDPDSIGELPQNFKSLKYQSEAVNQGYQMLLAHNGFFLSDVVGLGKTVIAALVAKRFRIANGSSNTKILVIYPPALEKNWKTTFRTFKLDRDTRFITNGRLEKLFDEDSDYGDLGEYDLILVDEAHRYRNHTSQMFSALQRICKTKRTGKGLIEGDRKKVILISATPLNNRPQDLYYLLQLFQDARASSLPETNLQSFFGPIIREYKEIIATDSPDLARIRELYAQIRERVIQPVTVRRTRNNLKNDADYRQDLKEQGIIFPEIAAPKAKVYQLDPKLNKLFVRTVLYLTEDIQYYRYQAIRFLTKEQQNECGYTQADLVSRSLAGIMKTLMIKRLESSFYAFRISLQNLLTATGRMIEMFEQNKVLIAPDLRVNDLQEKGMSVEEIELMIDTLSLRNPRNNVFEQKDFIQQPISKDDPTLIHLIDGLKADHRILTELLNHWNSVTNDPKLATFVANAQDEFFRKDLNPTGKLVIFTESTDTAQYLHENLEKALNTKILCVSSENRSKLFETILDNFDANLDPKKQKNDYHIIITTDVLAEGVNLHRANVIVNYDTPWNATRLMQRIGRVNRIGSVAGTIFNYNFYPSQQGDEEIKLYNKALVKLQGFHSAFGEDAQIFTHEELVEQFKLYETNQPDEEDKRREYLKLIRAFKENNPKEFKRIEKLPLKARTGRKSPPSPPDGGSQEGSTVVFLKSVFKTEFYKIDAQKKCTALTFLEAAALFEALPAEPAYDLPNSHYEQVRATLEMFEKDFFESNTETVSGGNDDKADGVTKQALKFLREYKATYTQNQEVRTVCDGLQKLIERGEHTPLPNEMKKLNTKISKREITMAQADVLLLALAKKYRIETDEPLEDKDLPVVIEPDIVIAETFI